MIKAVIFDLDDTLISEKEYIRSGYKQVAIEIAKKYVLDKKYVYKILLDTFEENPQNVFNRVLDKLSIYYEIEDIKRLVKVYRSHKPEIKLYDDAKYIIETLYKRRVKLGIITDGYIITQKNKLEVLGIEKYFEYIIITDELGREFWKPHRKSYDIMKNKLKVNYDEMIYVGDNVSKDFVTANKLGIETVFINREDGVYSKIKKHKSYLANLEVKDLKELKNLI